MILQVNNQLKLSSLQQSEAPAYFQLITQNQQYLGKWLTADSPRNLVFIGKNG
ncbi:hypothetical protein [Loigolactobacillus backii]|uniref:hypothetical protein n=1 Tax=Loigolactobacillus backii TaxID=375175 RepID=UPI000A913B04|nr:hypothetical protein [Loigolactobacillus backii]